MLYSISKPIAWPGSDAREDHRAQLKSLIERAGDLLPAQGPITAFVFLNTLQALEDLPFEEGLRRGARLFGCQPYLAEDRYRERMAHGRIRPEDLSAVLREDLGDQAEVPICSLSTRFELRLAMLRFPMRQGPAAELRWFVAETDSLKRLREEVAPAVRDRFLEETRHWVMRDLRNGTPLEESLDENGGRHVWHDLLALFDESSIEDWDEQIWETLSLQALWRVCREGVTTLEPAAVAEPPALRHRDVLLAASGEDSDALVHGILIRFCAAFADQGFAPWPLPNRDEGVYRSFCGLYGQAGGPPDRWLRGLARELNRLKDRGFDALDSIRESLELLDVSEDEHEDYITATLLSLRGWAGMLRQMEVRGDRVPLPAPPETLTEFVAVRLILERLALTHIAREKLNYDGPLDQLRSVAGARIAKSAGLSVDQRAFLVFQLAQVLGWCPPALARLTRHGWRTLVAEVEAFSGLEQRRVFQLAFERGFRAQALDALSLYAPRPARRVESPRFQAVFCIDTREESFRRHLEELAPDTETFGAAGFFGVPIYYRGISDAHFATLCPIVIRPRHWVVEDPVYPLEDANRRRAKTRRALGAATHQVHLGSRGIASGALLTAGVGVLASIPLVARVLFPQLTARIRRTASRWVEPPPITRLRLERILPDAGSEEGHVGFSVDEMADMSERLLRDIGLTSGFARLVLFLGHGSFCLNNPHKSAYDCGACSGGAGGPNARALAAMLNDPRVRAILAERGLSVPADTRFVGGLHNTCNDSITYYDLDLLPNRHVREFEATEQTLAEVCARNAHERCRRFESAPLDLSLAAAHRHVEGRSQDLAQTRPEYGNATNAVSFVGRRASVRGLYLDRRSFLVSYDPTQDDEQNSILARILGAVVPVCEGINLQYFFSHIDSTGWGCGTKLPHNVTSLLGVMDGAASDLRSGLPWQGVEIHEPIRLLFVIETTPQAIFSILERSEVLGRIIRNGWVQLALLDPHTSEIQLLRDGQFHRYEPEATHLPTAGTSADWYRGWRDHLAFAAIGPRGAHNQKTT